MWPCFWCILINPEGEPADPPSAYQPAPASGESVGSGVGRIICLRHQADEPAQPSLLPQQVADRIGEFTCVNSHIGKNMNETEMEFKSCLHEMLPEIELSDSQMQQLRIYYENLIAWNGKINLTAITEEKDVYVKHFLDSLTLYLCVPRETFHEGISVIDIGTGAGFPGIPLAIVMPEVSITLIDALGKRVRFLEDTAQKLGLENVICIHTRSEDLARNPDHRGKYNLATSRAVANLSILSEYCIPFLQEGGSFVAYKSDKTDEEIEDGIRAARILGAEMTNRRDFKLPRTDYHRTLLQFVKTKPTPGKYPRRAGTPSKEPLGRRKRLG